MDNRGKYIMYGQNPNLYLLPNGKPPRRDEYELLQKWKNLRSERARRMRDKSRAISPDDFDLVLKADWILVEDLCYSTSFAIQRCRELGIESTHKAPVIKGDKSQRSKRSQSKRLRFAVLSRDGFRCVYCGATPRRIQLHVDHVVPISAGGADAVDNMVTACADCNLGKHAKTGITPPRDGT